MSNVIRVEGFGSVVTSPNMMRFSYELVQDGNSYAESYSSLLMQYQAIVDAFKKVVFNTSLIKTSSINVSMIHAYENQPKQFRTSQQLIFEDKIDLDRMNALLDALRSATDFNFSLSYFIKNSSKQDTDAITLAVTDATDKAKVIASASGVKLGKIRSIEYVTEPYAGPYARTASLDMVATDITISQRVVMSWEI